ncbi:unnamed protein product, partial [Mesorhabditis belari]|uniref:Cortactin-binding protein-2 N-terminal domain-containing protein n=1 Tax=Mesorhabditis belari TaxID=2138241 RepID=A0AAF3FF41_9BILA
MEFDYDDSTAKCLPSPYDNGTGNDTMIETQNGGFVSLLKNDLVRLLQFVEQELEKRDDCIQKLKDDRTRQMLFEAKYGRISMNDPLVALRRDSEVAGEQIDEDAIGRLYESQLVQLEKLIAAQKKSHNRAKMILSTTERRHAKALKELELEKERKSRYAAQGDDVVAFLENERAKLQQQVEFQIGEVANAKVETEKVEKKLQVEKEKHKAMILFLINERKQLLLKIHEMRLKGEPPNVPDGYDVSMEELRREVEKLKIERDTLGNANKALRAENLSLKEVVRGHEADLLLLRRNLIRNPAELTSAGVEGSLVLANRMSSTPSATLPGPSSRPTSRISTSSSFPSSTNDSSRLPRAPPTQIIATTITPARSKPNPPMTRLPSTPTARNPQSPTKKTPAMGVGVNSVRQQRPISVSTPQVPTTHRFTAEPELQQLEEAIHELEMTSSDPSPTSSFTKGKTEPRRVEIPVKSPNNTAQITTATTATVKASIAKAPEKPAERKLSGTIKKGSLLKAFSGK